MKRIISILFVVIIQFSLIAQWQFASGISGVRVSSFGKTSNYVFAGTNSGGVFFGQGVFRSSDEGANWSQINNGLMSFDIARIVAMNDTVYLVTPNASGGIYKSKDNGENWSVSLQDLALDLVIVGTDLYAISPGLTLYKSEDYGKSWISFPTGISANFLALFYHNNNLYLATSGQGVYKSTNFGLNWVSLPNAPNLIFHFTSFGIKLYGGTDSHIQLSTDNGNSWSSVLASGSIRALLSAGSIIFSSNGWYLPDGGTWTNFNSQISNETIISLGASDNYLFVGAVSSLNQGIWRKPFSQVLSVEEIPGILPDDYKLYPNYPNPFNPETTLEFSLPKIEFVLLTVTNILGEHIETLVSEELSVGTYKTKWNAYNYPSGVYMVNLRTGSYSKSIKVILEK